MAAVTRCPRRQLMQGAPRRYPPGPSMLAALGHPAWLRRTGVGLARPPRSPRCVLGRLPGAGLGFAKMLGLLLVTWVVWMAASLHVVAYGVPLIVGVLSCSRSPGCWPALRLRALGGRLGARPGRSAASGSRGSRCPSDPVRRRLFLGAEAVFAVAYALGVLLASFAPDVWNTEKPMDMAFINAINASSHFPPHDPWMSGEHAQLLLPRPRRAGLADQAARHPARQRLPAVLGRCCSALDRDRTSTRSRARCGRRRARRSAVRSPRGGPVLAGLVGARW